VERRFYNAKEIAQYLGMSEDAVRKWALRGQIPFSKFGKSLRFDLRRIESWTKNKESAFTRQNL
jgi:excisionase family DNA binding protein